MADEAPAPKRRGSCLGSLATLVSFLGMAGLGAAVFFVWQPQDLSDVKGRTSPGAAEPRTRDLRAVLRNAVDKQYPLTLTEEEINLYLRQTLEAKQGGLLGRFVSLDAVSVRIEDERAEIVTERTVAGRPLTISMYARVEQVIDVRGKVRTRIGLDGGPLIPQLERTERLKSGGRFGRLVVSQGFLHLVIPCFQKLAAVYQPELSLAFEEMSRISLEKGKLVLDPRDDGGASLFPGE